MATDALTMLHNDDGELDKRRIARILDLERENAAMREIVQAVAGTQPIVAWGSEFREICGLCKGHQPVDDDGLLVEDAPIQHTPDCPITKARALLNKS